MKFILLPFSVIFLLGCSSSVSQKDADQLALAQAENDNNYVCQTIKKTGSHFNKRRCITKEAKAREEENAKKTLEELDRNWSVNGG